MQNFTIPNNVQERPRDPVYLPDSLFIFQNEYILICMQVALWDKYTMQTYKYELRYIFHLIHIANKHSKL